MNGRHHTDEAKDAAIADYRQSGDTYRVVAARHGVSRSILHSWVNPDGVKPRKPKSWGADELELTNGHWTPNRRGIQIWQPCFFNTIQACNINHQENRRAA